MASTSETKTLWVLRHGDANFHAQQDQLREISEKGFSQIQKQAEYLNKNFVSVDEIWVSPYLRTQQTSKHLLNYWTHDKEIKILDLLRPESSVADIIDYLSTHAPQNLMLISHQPLVNRLISSLCVNHQSNINIEFMNTASLACLHSEIWSTGWASLKLMEHA